MSELTKLELAQRNDIFRYTELSHPLMQILFNFKAKETPPETDDFIQS